MRDFQFIIVSTIAEMRTLVELRCDFGWNGHISVDPRAIRFTGLEIRRIAGEEKIDFGNYRVDSSPILYFHF